MEIIDEMGIRVVDAAPPGYASLTVPISLETETHIIRSIWESLSSTEAVATIEGNGTKKVEFWRKAVPGRRVY